MKETIVKIRIQPMNTALSLIIKINCNNKKVNIIATPAPLGVGRIWLDLSLGISTEFSFFKIGMLSLIEIAHIKKLVIKVMNQMNDVSLIKITFLKKFFP